MSLSQRLSELKKFYSGQPSVWDIGCDHGLLGLSFKMQHLVEEIHLVDPSGAVIEKLKEKRKDSDIPKSPFILIEHKRGQDITLSSKPNCLFIAGMGGKEIRDIIKAITPQLTQRDTIIISPHRNVLLLREFLHQSPLRLVSEEVCHEDGQYYPILVLTLDETLPRVSLYGKILWHSKVGQDYCRQQIKAFETHQDPKSRAYLSYLKQNMD